MPRFQRLKNGISRALGDSKLVADLGNRERTLLFSQSFKKIQSTVNCWNRIAWGGLLVLTAHGVSILEYLAMKITRCLGVNDN